MIIAVDFDGTLCDESNYPLIGEARRDVIDWVNKQQNKYGHELVLWTLRTGVLLFDAAEWCKNNGLNIRLPKWVLVPEAALPWLEKVNGDKQFYIPMLKVHADLYLDDKSGNVQDIIKLENAKDFKRG